MIPAYPTRIPSRWKGHYNAYNPFWGWPQTGRWPPPHTSAPISSCERHSDRDGEHGVVKLYALIDDAMNSLAYFLNVEEAEAVARFNDHMGAVIDDVTLRQYLFVISEE